MKNKNTKPELICQNLLKSMNISFKAHESVGGCVPDLIVEDASLAIFVHGCYWHDHGCQSFSKITKQDFANEGRKIETSERDKRNLDKVRQAGYRAIVIWECELHNPEAVKLRIERRVNLATFGVS